MRHMEVEELDDGSFKSKSHSHARDDYGACGTSCTSASHDDADELSEHVKKHFSGKAKTAKKKEPSLSDLNRKFKEKTR